MRLPRRHNSPELLDQVHADLAELQGSLTQIGEVNRWLGGNRAVLRHLQQVLPSNGRVLDVGTGDAALPRVIARWAHRERRRVHVTAVDLNPQMVQLARAACRGLQDIDVRAADARDLPFADRSFDAAVMNLTLHHFDDADERRVLQELQRVSRTVIVCELERCWPNYVGARLLALTWWRRNRITRHDGPLSVLRAYTPHELLATAREAGLHNIRVHRHFFHRLLLVAAA